MVRKAKARRDMVGTAAAFIALLLILAVTAAQIALTSPSWRARMSPVDIMEGVSPEEALMERGKDLPQTGHLW